MELLDTLRLLLSVLLFGLGLLGLFKVPLGALWKPAVAATEWGHVLAVFPLLLLLLPVGAGLGAQLAWGLAALAALLLLSSLGRALGYVKGLEARFAKLFGNVQPPALPGAPARSAPLVLGDLLSVSTPMVTPTRHTYREVDGHTLQLDLYRSAGATRPLPLVVVIHGGSWNSGDSTQLNWLNSYLAARGVAVAAINYRLAPRHTFPAQRDDALAALAWLKENASSLEIDPTRIAFLGRSAGGQLALLAAYTARDPAIRAVVALYAPSDLNWGWVNPTNPLVMDSPKTLSEYLGGTPAQVQAHFDAGSPIDFVIPSSPPTLLVHGTRDELVLVEQSRRLARRLEQANVPYLELELPWATHGCDANPAGPGGQITTWAVERFLAAAFQDAPRKAA
ncbi:alpha/beta hydrolase [Archangium lansingense]|uniref:Alpha/beta hydrolase n=1 Tax=Archangium lansingense TaxID=2995310 RepID=A0ABT4AC86_9BACT|nr:alpha/beta hydrolase [Archangium lansinium]MCY1079288.1 alpha/beta hydrolase [Archangium lansinium]